MAIDEVAAPRAAPLLTVLCGGLGGARLALALRDAGLEGQACFVTNVADDCEYGGLSICPDTDAVLYALGGLFDEERGWGIRGDIFPEADSVSDGWFHVGMRDGEQHRRRGALLAAGNSLTVVTARLAGRLGVRAAILPATDARVRTRVHTPRGALDWQEWLVREQGRPPVVTVEYRGIESARPTTAVLDAVRLGGLLVLAASSPVASIGPILALPGLRDALRRRTGPTVALSPIALRHGLRSERDLRRAAARAALLAARGVAHDPIAIAATYADLIDAYVLDDGDAADAGAIARLGLVPLVAPIVEREGGARLVAALLGLLPGRVRPARAAAAARPQAGARRGRGEIDGRQRGSASIAARIASGRGR